MVRCAGDTWKSTVAAATDPYQLRVGVQPRNPHVLGQVHNAEELEHANEGHDTGERDQQAQHPIELVARAHAVCYRQRDATDGDRHDEPPVRRARLRLRRKSIEADHVADELYEQKEANDPPDRLATTRQVVRTDRREEPEEGKKYANRHRWSTHCSHATDHQTGGNEELQRNEQREETERCDGATPNQDRHPVLTRTYDSSRYAEQLRSPVLRTGSDVPPSRCHYQPAITVTQRRVLTIATCFREVPRTTVTRPMRRSPVFAVCRHLITTGLLVARAI